MCGKVEENVGKYCATSWKRNLRRCQSEVSTDTEKADTMTGPKERYQKYLTK